MASDVCITLDVDWASNRVLGDALQLVSDLDVPVTLFCTHPTALLEGLDPARYELAWHPDYLGERPEQAVLEELAAWFPGASGVRSHALYFHSRLAPIYLDRGIRYLAHDLRFGEPGLAPTTHWSGLVNVPGFWEDDVHALYFDGDFDPDRIDLTSPGLRVFDFHPIHLHLNTDRMDRYEAARAEMEAGADLSAHVNPGLGSRTFLEEVVVRMKAGPHHFTTVAQVADAHATAHPYTGRYRIGD